MQKLVFLIHEIQIFDLILNLILCTWSSKSNKSIESTYRASRKDWVFSTPSFGINPSRYFKNSFFSLCAINLHLVYQNMSRPAQCICSGEFFKVRYPYFSPNVIKLFSKFQILFQASLLDKNEFGC